jgi:hypothetical protein
MEWSYLWKITQYGMFMLLICSGVGSKAQTVKNEIDVSSLRNPIIHAVPDQAKWEIFITYPQAATVEKNKGNPIPGGGFIPPSKITVTWTKPFCHIVQVDMAGHVTEVWFDGSQAYMIDSSNLQVNPVDPLYLGKTSVFINYPEKGFPDMDWVSAKTYVGTTILDSLHCLEFKQGTTVVLVDINTRLPICWQRNGEIRRYKFFPVPEEKLQLPDAVMKMSKILETIRQNNDRMPPHGG